MFHIISSYRILFLFAFLAISFVFHKPSFATPNTDQANQKIHRPKTIGIIVPLEHEAMLQIISGIKESLADMDVEVLVKNAHSDPNIMLALIKQIKDQDIDLIMPIGTSASQMTISHIKDKPIICVAALPDTTKNPLVTGINDEIPISVFISKLPKLSNITVIYSASEKVAPEINALKTYAQISKISLHFFMIQNLIDLPLVVRNAPKDTQGFLILKDHLVVSAINILSQEAKKRSIPVIASDEGSVINGANLAMGIKEKDIGIESGLIAKKILEGADPKNIPHKMLDKFVLFMNEKAFLEQKILTDDDITALKMTIVKY